MKSSFKISFVEHSNPSKDLVGKHKTSRRKIQVQRQSRLHSESLSHHKKIQSPCDQFQKTLQTSLLPSGCHDTTCSALLPHPALSCRAVSQKKHILL